MDSARIKAHWRNWANRYKENLRATTKASTLKLLEIDALSRTIGALHLAEHTAVKALEAGCGNGWNCVELARAFPTFRFTGFDYVEEMIDCARLNARTGEVEERVSFEVGNVLELDAARIPERGYDLVFTDRCLINLVSTEEQKQAIAVLAGRLTAGGVLLMIENSLTTYERQNDCREALGLPRRQPEAFNRFFDEDEIVPCLEALFAVVRVEDFISLHDLMLYVLLPAANGGEIDYEHPLVHLAAKLSREMPTVSSLGGFGQNRLYICDRPLPR